MFGMDSMSGAVAPLKDVPEFAEVLLWFKNPILGVLAGALLTAIIQSSSASVGILQALSAQVQYLRLSASYNFRTEYRYLRNSTAFINRHKQERKACGSRTPLF